MFVHWKLSAVERKEERMNATSTTTTQQQWQHQQQPQTSSKEECFANSRNHDGHHKSDATNNFVLIKSLGTLRKGR